MSNYIFPKPLLDGFTTAVEEIGTNIKIVGDVANKSSEDISNIIVVASKATEQTKDTMNEIQKTTKSARTRLETLSKKVEENMAEIQKTMKILGGIVKTVKMHISEFVLAASCMFFGLYTSSFIFGTENGRMIPRFACFLSEVFVTVCLISFICVIVFVLYKVLRRSNLFPSHVFEFAFMVIIFFAVVFFSYVLGFFLNSLFLTVLIYSLWINGLRDGEMKEQKEKEGEKNAGNSSELFSRRESFNIREKKKEKKWKEIIKVEEEEIEVTYDLDIGELLNHN